MGDNLLSHLSDKDAVAIDDTKYHSRRTDASKYLTAVSGNAEIQKWLVRKGNKRYQIGSITELKRNFQIKEIMEK